MFRITIVAAISFFGFLSASFAETPPVEHFARLPFLKQVQVSPGGKYFSAMLAAENRYLATVFEFTDDGPKAVYSAKEDDELWVRMFRWVNEDRIVLSLGYHGRRYRTDTVESRLYGLTVGENDLETLFYTGLGDVPAQFEDDIVSWMDHDPDHILVQYRASLSADFPTVFRVQVNQRRIHKTVQRQRNGIHDWYADAQGVVRAGRGFKRNNEKENKLIIRMSEDDDWRDISHRVSENAPDFYIHGFSERPNIAYVESGHQFDPGGLYEYDIETDSFGRLIFRDPSSEVAHIYSDPKTGKIRGILYGSEINNIEWLDEALKDEVRMLRAQFSDKTVRLLGESIDQNFAIFDISDTSAPSQYYIFDREGYRLIQLPILYPELANYEFAQIETTEYAARDGLSVPAYVTLPAGARSLEELKSAPFIILPHGGPTSRDFLRFDYWAQFLASRGYAVFQMNFRGSSGYGESFREAGARQWGQAMQDDITDGAQWLIERGYADADRIAIMGGSYGGYAALMGAVKTPDLYQCAISLAGVSDLPDLLHTARDFIGGKAGTRHIGNLWKDGDSLRENSPARRAEDIQIPVLLFHGEDDRVVDVLQSKKMRNALRRAGKEYEYIELPKGDHSLSLYSNRLTFLQETERFLGDCLKEQ